ncbi:MAG: T9SS type A sorting domain-containing protein, partial [Saprospiraceae bacterium]|nr:T9SS type A sorting domain-containing protein [Saprospiraceae bacterium]
PMPSEYVADWIEVRECDTNQDTAKIIYRQYAAIAKDGTRGIGHDTFYVLRLPPLSAANLFCAEMDTIYCGGDREGVGPYIVLPPADALASDCDTIFLLNEDLSAVDISPKCGFSIKVDSLPFSGTTCNRLTQVEVQIYQDCYGAEDVHGSCAVGSSDAVFSGGMGEPIFAICSFWLIELDTAPPVVACILDGYAEVDTTGGIPTATVDAGPTCTSSNMILPPVVAADSCSDVIQVKAIVDTLGSFIYDYDPIAGVYRNSLHVPLPFRDEPYVIIIEALDACTNVGRDTCAVVVRDITSPTVVNHPSLNIDLSDKQGFLRASQIDNGTTDNCELGFVLARRTDWLSSWPDFCDSLRLTVTPADDSIWCHKIVDPGMAISDLEVFYRSMMDSIQMSTLACSDLLLDAWQYDLCRYATVVCKGSLSQDEFDVAYAAEFGVTNVAELGQIGGGWGVEVPFSCVDACDSVPIELLAMDSWCNYSTGWAKVLVKDDNPPSVAQALEDYLEVSCAALNLDTIYTLGGNQVTLNDIVQAAEAGEAEALAALDSTFGTYVKAWTSPTGMLVDLDGVPIPEELTFIDVGLCRSDQVTRRVRYYDRDLGMMVEQDSLVDRYFREDKTLMLQQGILDAECANISCTQSVTSDLDDCGLGVITRTFTIWKSCPGIDTSDALVLTQEILLKNTCALKKEQFILPQDTILYTCLPEREIGDLNHINGAADPDSIGAPVYIFEDGCRNIGIARVDESVTNSADDACFFIYRTWYFADWCASDSIGDWWTDESLVSDSFTQVIVFRDSIDPVCTVLMPDTIRLSVCGQIINPMVAFADDCALRQFHYSFDTIGDAPIKTGSPFLMPTPTDTVTLEVFMLTNGRYTLDILVTDHCGNESVCKDTVVIECDVSRQAASQMDMAAHEKDVNSEKGVDDDHSISRLGRPVGDPPSNALLDGSGYMLHQNRPNPFEYNSVVGFSIPQSEEVNISMYDVQGRLLRNYQGTYGKGYHELEINRNELDVTGILYYRMTTKAFTATRKMIISP